MRWEAHGASDRGRVRKRNEDSFLVRADAGLFAVADGMGGHAAGDVASALAIETLTRRLKQLASAAGGGAERRREALVAALHAANQAILEAASSDPAQGGMGTTTTALWVSAADGTGVIAHIGDSRAYLLRSGELRQLTTDHTWVQREVEQGRLSARKARVHPYSSVLTHALGVAEEERVDGLVLPLEPGDLLMLCTDGLSGLLEDEQLRAVLLGASDDDDPAAGVTSDDPAAAEDAATALPPLANALIRSAIEAGGPDNVTVVLVRISAD